MHPKCAHCDADAVIDPTMPDGINLPLCTKHASETLVETAKALLILQAVKEGR